MRSKQKSRGRKADFLGVRLSLAACLEGPKLRVLLVLASIRYSLGIL